MSPSSVLLSEAWSSSQVVGAFGPRPFLRKESRPGRVGRRMKGDSSSMSPLDSTPKGDHSQMGFAKVFEEVTISSINEEELHVRWLFIVALTLCNRDGKFRATLPGLARTANITTKQATDAMAVLQAPDPNSTSPDHDGRRIVPDGDGANGWRVVNYKKYRALRSHQDRLEQQRQNREQRKLAGIETFNDFWSKYQKGRKVNKKRAQDFWCTLSESDQADALKAIPNHVRLWEEERRELKYIPHPLTWLRARRWEDDIDTDGGAPNPFMEGDAS